MLSAVADAKIVFRPMPTVHFGTGAIGALPGTVRDTGGEVAVIVTDPALAGTPRMPTSADIIAILAAAQG
jgi:alcohol dehydrogenase class IV